jgi:hypothetical protein
VGVVLSRTQQAQLLAQLACLVTFDLAQQHGAALTRSEGSFDLRIDLTLGTPQQHVDRFGQQREPCVHLGINPTFTSRRLGSFHGDPSDSLMLAEKGAGQPFTDGLIVDHP